MLREFSWKNLRPQKTAAVIRYGAWGDVLQSASILPRLKKEGFHVTFFCTPRGIEAIKHDPHIDRFVLQDEDAVPNHELAAYFDYLKTRFTKVINLCETVEGVVLPMSHRAHFHWPKEARHAICNKNYVELQHQVAGIPYIKPENYFYPTQEELEWARKEKPGRSILWCVAGSGVHKIWPHLEDCIRAIFIAHPTVNIILTGHASEKELQPDWDYPRLHKKVGLWSIRQTMTMATVSDIVIGPETGIMTAVSMEPMRKILILSHSTVENLSRDWMNTISLAAENAECYPCHRLQLDGWKYCNRHPNGNAMCQVLLTPDRVYDAVMRSLKDEERLAA